MHHQHFHSIGSTQIFLKENLERLKESDDDILISCSEQTGGIGRRGNSWDTYPNSLAISFTLKPNSSPSLTPIEIGMMAIRFFKTKFNQSLFLKWPNDLLTEDGKKCGGILCQYVDENTVIVGLGVNLGKLESNGNHSYRHGLGSVDHSDLKHVNQEELSKELYEYFLSNRYHDISQIKKDFDLFCYHMNMDVFIYEDEQDHLGIFRGIGDNGEAMVEINSRVQPFLSSSLTILN